MFFLCSSAHCISMVELCKKREPIHPLHLFVKYESVNETSSVNVFTHYFYIALFLGVFNISGGTYSTTVDIIPVIAGFLPLPRVKLYKYTRPHSQKEGMVLVLLGLTST